MYQLLTHMLTQTVTAADNALCAIIVRHSSLKLNHTLLYAVVHSMHAD